MMETKELQIFNNPEFGQVRTVTIDGEPWFIGKDVANALGYGKGKSLNNAVANHVDAEDKGVTEMMTPGGKQNLTIINESGLYSLILSSKLPNAKKFKRWVTSEVLPAIRKTGRYTQQSANEKPITREPTMDDYIRIASIISGCKNERLPYVLGVLKKSGIELPLYFVKSNESAKNRDVTGRAASAINTAMLIYGLKLSEIARLTGISKTQIARIRKGESKPYISRARFICDTLHNVVPEIPAYEES